MTSRVDERKIAVKRGDPGPLLVTMSIGGIKLSGMLVATGCHDNFISLSTLQEMGFKTDFLLEYQSHVVDGALGERLRIVGEWIVEVELGEKPCQTTVATLFKVVDSPLLYNAIIGRSLLCAIEASFSLHRIEFPTPHGTGVLRKDPDPLLVSRVDERKQVSKQGDPGPLLVTLSIAGIKLSGILVTTGCHDNFISLSMLHEMGFKTDFLREYQSHVVVGAFGERLRIVGEWIVDIKMGENPCQTTVATLFKVVDSPLLYNAIMGRSLLCAIDATVSVHRIEFPTPHGTGVMRKDPPKPKREN